MYFDLSFSPHRVGRGRRRRILPQDNSKSSPPPFKRKRRTRESIGRGGRGAGGASGGPAKIGRGGRMVGRPGRGSSAAAAGSGPVDPDSDEDVDSESAAIGLLVGAAASVGMMGTRARTEAEVTRLDRLDNAALAALAQPRPNVASKYNFYVQLGRILTHLLCTGFKVARFVFLLHFYVKTRLMSIPV